MHAAEQTTYRAPRESAPDKKTGLPSQDRPTPDAHPSLRTAELTTGGNATDQVRCEEQIQAALINTLKSSEFQSAPQLQAFLGFVVHATLNKQQEKIKGYTIAVEALGRPEDFNPVTDPIVRVEAARLRRRLEKYYAGSGADDPVRITIPKGSYAPEFHPVQAGALPDCSADLVARDMPGRTPAPEATTYPDLETGEVPYPVHSYHVEQSPAPLLRAGKSARNRTAPVALFDDLRGTLAKPVAPRLVLALCLTCFLAGYLIASL